MSTEWEGKSRGTVFGYKIFVFCIKRLGIRVAYFILYFVTLYFCFFAFKSTKASYRYFRKRHNYSFLNSLFAIYRSYYVFGQTLIDRVAIASGMRDTFTYEFDGIENLEDVLAQKKGGILISAHVGNFEVSQYFLSELDHQATINLLTTDAEVQSIKKYLDGQTEKSQVKFIIIQEDLSHIFEMNAALARNEIICVTGDRFMKDAKTLESQFLGAKAEFPAGPFLLGTRLGAPILFVYVMKETTKHYHLYARKQEFIRRAPDLLLEKYVASLEMILKKYPLQWFNYFDFWNSKGQ